MNPDRKLFRARELPRIFVAFFLSACAFSEGESSSPQSSKSADRINPPIPVTIYPTVPREPYSNDALPPVEHPTSTPAPQGPENKTALVLPETLFGNEAILGKNIFITIDDCYDTKILRTMFETLKRHGATATFFPNIPPIITEEMKALWREIYEAGNEIGYHTTNHDFGSGSASSNWTVEQLHKDFDMFTQVMRDILRDPAYMPRFVRPPYGVWNHAWMTFVRERGVTNVRWTYVPDEQYPNIDYFGAVRKHPHGGGIILIHTRIWDAQWLQENIAGLQALAGRDGGALVSFRHLR